MTTIDELEARIAALEQIAAPEETTQASYLSIDPATGLVSANFSGIIQAFGLELPEGGVFPFGVTPQSAIQWTDSQGALYAQVQAFRSVSGLDNLVIECLQPTPASDFGNNLRLLAHDSDNSESAEVDVNTANNDTANTAILLNCTVGGTVASRKLLDAAGDSDFIQCPNIARAAITFGHANLTFSSSTVAGTQAVLHGLGRVPQAVLVTPGVGASTAVVAGYASALTSTQFTMASTSTVSLNQSVTYFWLAIG